MPGYKNGPGVVNLHDRVVARRVERLHALGPRILYEMLAELGAAWMLGSEIDTLITRYLAAFTTRTVH
jgi:hypothetical protein